MKAIIEPGHYSKSMKINCQKQLLFKIFSLTFGIGIALIMAELLLRVFGIGYGNAPLVSDPILHHVHPTNYTFLSHGPRGEYGGHPVCYNEDGLVTNPNRQAIKAKDCKYRIAFLGDSFVESGQVAYSASFIGRLQASADGLAEIRNYGVASYSPIYYLLQWREKVRHFQPTHVFILLYSNDISTDEQVIKQAICDSVGNILAIPGAGGGWLIEQMRKSYVVRFIRKVQLQLKWSLENRGKAKDIVGNYVEENPDISELSSQLLSTLAEEIQNSNGKFILMAVPSKYRLAEHKQHFSEPQFSDKLKKWAEQNAMEFVDLVQSFQQASKSGNKLFFEQDIHFNELGHAVVAKTLAEKYGHIFQNGTNNNKLLSTDSSQSLPEILAKTEHSN